MNKIVSSFILIVLSSCTITKNARIEEPKYNKEDVYVKHYAYSLVFNPQTKQADWVAYKLHEYQTETNFKRTNKFIIDTLILTGTATNSDYYKSGYDKGHLAPASDMTWNKQAMYESFYFSNITPQLAEFNRGIWKKLEMQVRNWATKYDSIYICTGPVFISPTQTIGNNKINIPSHFYKTILIYNDTVKQAIGFVFSHQESNSSIFNYAVSVDSVEQLINLDLHKALPNRYERKIEETYDLKYW